MPATREYVVYPVDICLNGDRNYVQAVQMIAGAADRLLAIDPRHENLNLETFAFRRITVNDVGVALAETDHGLAPESSFGEAIFADGERITRAWFVELETLAPRAMIAEAVSFRKLSDAPPLGGTFAFEGVSGFPDLLVLVTQTVKCLHAELGPHVHDIWLSGMRGAKLPIAATWPAAGGEIAIRNVRVRGSPAQKQSLSQVEISLAGDKPERFSAGVTFAFKE